MIDDEARSGTEKAANDNPAPDGPGTGSDADAFERLDKVVLSIARLIGRRLAREDYEKAVHAVNDNKESSGRTGEKYDHPGGDDGE